MDALKWLKRKFETYFKRLVKDAIHEERYEQNMRAYAFMDAQLTMDIYKSKKGVADEDAPVPPG